MRPCFWPWTASMTTSTASSPTFCAIFGIPVGGAQKALFSNAPFSKSFAVQDDDGSAPRRLTTVAYNASRGCVLSGGSIFLFTQKQRKGGGWGRVETKLLPSRTNAGRTALSFLRVKGRPKSWRRYFRRCFQWTPRARPSR